MGSRLSGSESLTSNAHILVQYGEDFDAAVKQRINLHLVTLDPKMETLPAEATAPIARDLDTIVLAFGKSAIADELISDHDVRSQGPEGFKVRSVVRGSATIFAARGNPGAENSLSHGNIGNSYAAYAALESLGFAFLRPLAPLRPAALPRPTTPINMDESPRWRIRTMHIHTQHPLELTNLLQGWGATDPDDESSWKAMLPMWDSYLEWLIANRQNRVEWALLWAKSWENFAESAERQSRLKQLIDRGHAYGLAIGVDVPIAFSQQHAYQLIRRQSAIHEQLIEMRRHLDWLMQSGFDFLGTEAGSSEFTHPAADQMLRWMNEFADYTWGKYKKPTYIKIHCSSGQLAKGYLDPRTGKTLNFNFLPYYASPHLGVLPHTVEHYGLDDPAPVYGNQNFTYMRDYLALEVGRREVVWYPETSYWVSFDIDVPLFLPIYAERRLHDLRLLALDEDQGRFTGSARMDGQQIFSSGYEWGYWFNDVVAARAAWNPQLSAGSDFEALSRLIRPSLTILGDKATAVIDWINSYAAAQHDLLILGKVQGEAPSSIVMRNGQAYLQGFDTWDDVSTLAKSLPVKAAQMTQPERLGLVNLRRDHLNKDAPDYRREVAPLLAAMAETFRKLADEGNSLAKDLPAGGENLIKDLADAAEMTALRAEQIYALYEYVDLDVSQNPQAQDHLATARKALAAAAEVVAKREAHYAVGDKSLVNSWREGPTAYNFGYLWTVHSLYYWWRDEGKAVDAPLSPCYLNIINPIDVGFGEGLALSAEKWLTNLINRGDSRGCLDAPRAEPHF